MAVRLTCQSLRLPSPSVGDSVLRVLFNGNAHGNQRSCTTTRFASAQNASVQQDYRKTASMRPFRIENEPHICMVLAKAPDIRMSASAGLTNETAERGTRPSRETGTQVFTSNLKVSHCEYSGCSMHRVLKICGTCESYCGPRRSPRRGSP